jgi:hypothetical protein
VFHIILDIITRNNCWRNNQKFTLQTDFRLWDKLLNVFLKTNKARCGQQSKVNMNANWNEEVELVLDKVNPRIQILSYTKLFQTICFQWSITQVHHWLQSNHEKGLIFELLILNDKRYNKHHSLEKWWHLLHDKFHIIFWNGGAIGLIMNNIPIT